MWWNLVWVNYHRMGELKMSEETISDFSKYSSWLRSLEDMDETLWSKSIA